MATRRYSRQRELIYEALRATTEHPTAETLHRTLKQDCPGLSLGTVYRNLNILAEEGLICRMPFPVERYDGETARHPHLCCNRCGGVFDIALSYDPVLDCRAAEAGHKIDGHDLVFYGICTNCRGKMGNPSAS